MVGTLDGDTTGIGNQVIGVEVLGAPEVAVKDGGGVKLAFCGEVMKS